MVTRILVLTWADIVASYALWMMMIYLTDVWRLNITHAAAIINLFMGLISIMPFAIQFTVDTLFGNYWVVLISSIAYSAGLGFLTMSTPPVLAGATGTCSAYEPKCLGDGQRILFYTALALIAVGMSGHITSLANFIAEQFIIDMLDDEGLSTCSFMTLFFSSHASIFVLIAAVLGLPYINPWSLRFGVPAIVTAVATLVFLSGSCADKYFKPEGSPLTTVFRVIVASTSKLFKKSPENPNELYETNDTNLLFLPHTHSLRCLDKAAVVLPNKPLEEQLNNRWRLCRVTEVEETKSALRMLPMCLIFIMCGVVSSIGLTFFVEQAKQMNHKVGHLTIPLPLFFWIYDQGKQQCAKIFIYIAQFLGVSRARKYVPHVGIAISMVFAIICCVTAAKVENRRLDVVRSHGLIDKLDERIPMSVFWLLPQFLLLGAFDGVFEKSIALFFMDQVTPTISRCVMLFSCGVHGLGLMCSILLVHVVGKVNVRGGKPSWFQKTLNQSRVDEYYWTLSWLIAINLALYILLATCYAYRDSRMEDQDAIGAAEPFEDDIECCCCC